jgi:hypothetical protein
MKYWRQLVLRIAERIHERRNPFKAQNVAAGRKLRKAIQLRLHKRVIRSGMVGHVALYRQLQN